MFSSTVSDDSGKLIEDPIQAHSICSEFFRDLDIPIVCDVINTRVNMLAYINKYWVKKAIARINSI